METIEIKVHSTLYGVTDCVINVEDFINGRRVFPCGDGCDHKLNEKEVSEVYRQLMKDFNCDYQSLEKRIENWRKET
jgi:hypothetical protein